MSYFEAWGGPLDGKVTHSPDATLPWVEVQLIGDKPPLSVAGEYRPSPPGTEVTNADGLPIWHWYPSE